MTVVAFPTKYESEDFVQRLEKRSSKTIGGVPCHQGIISGVGVVVCIIGMGAEASARNMDTVLKNVSASVVIMAGFAGALSSQVHRGQVLVTHGYSSDDLINYLKLIPGFDIGLLCTSPKLVSTKEEKQKLGEASGCQMVDMEMAGVAEVVEEHGLEILGVRAISDTLDEDLPADVLEKAYNYEESKETPTRLALHLLLHPKRIAPFKAFLASLPQVRKNLTDFLVAAVEELD